MIKRIIISISPTNKWSERFRVEFTPYIISKYILPLVIPVRDPPETNPILKTINYVSIPSVITNENTSSSSWGLCNNENTSICVIYPIVFALNSKLIGVIAVVRALGLNMQSLYTPESLRIK